MATSRFQDLRTALVTRIIARLAADAVTGVRVLEYGPTGDTVREDLVWIGRIQVDQEPLSMGGASRMVDETLSLELHVRTPRHGASQADMKKAEERSETVWASIENDLRASSSVGGAVMFIEVDSFESDPTFDELGAVGVIDATVTASANI